MGVTICILILLTLPVVLYVYEDKQNQEYFAELKELDEPYMRLLETGALSSPDYKRHEYRS